MVKSFEHARPRIHVQSWEGHPLHQIAAELRRSTGEDIEFALWETTSPEGNSPQFSVHQPGRFSYLALCPARSVMVRNDTILVKEHFVEFTLPLAAGATPIDVAQDELQSLALSWSSCKDEATRLMRELPPFIGGLVGFIAYDCARYLERVRGAAAHAKQADLYYMLTTSLVVIDRRSRKLFLIEWQRNSDELLYFEKFKNILHRLPPPLVALRTTVNAETSLPASSLFSPEDFAKQVVRAKDYISAGDVFQVVLANSFHLAAAADPLDLYASLRELNPSPYHFLFSTSSFGLVGASPEVMLRASSAKPDAEHQREATVLVATRPVAGTYPRNKVDDRAAAASLLRADVKEQAEHIMLVDHCRNDLGRVARTGSVRVSDLLSIETYRDVHHLVSQVSAVLRPAESVFSALRSCFPISTLTGTPKIRAMEIIAELEGPSRGAFGGAAFIFGPDDFLDSAVIIRTAYTDGIETIVQAGAGIVYDSVPEREALECMWKAKAVLQAAARSTLRSREVR